MSEPAAEQIIVEGLGELAAALTRLGARRVLIVCGPSRRFVSEVQAALTQFETAVCERARVHVPRGAVDAARAELDAFAADTLLSVGGGSATGLAKALRLERDVRFVALPTTYAGSEYTTLYGVTDAGQKQTGRSERVRPDAVCLEPRFAAGMSTRESVSSLLNALAHPLSALFGGGAVPLTGVPLAAECVSAARETLWVLHDLLKSGDDARTRRRALVAAGRCARCLEGASLGAQHRWVHAVGGRYGAEHGSLHAVLLPHALRLWRQHHPELTRALAEQLALPDLEGTVFDLLQRARAHTSLRAVLQQAVLKGAASQRPAQPAATEARSAVCFDTAWFDETLRELEALGLPREIAENALLGRRPSASVNQLDLGLEHPAAHWGKEPESARRVIVAYHGRGSTAETILRRAVEVAGDDPELCVIAPQAPYGSWGASSYDAPLHEVEAQLSFGLERHLRWLESLTDRIGADRLVLFGFSQGACVVLELFARLGRPLGAVVALSGARFGKPEEATPLPAELAGTRVLLGVSERDAWVASADVARTAAQLEGAGCRVEVRGTTGDRHEVFALQRILARPLLRGTPPAAPTWGFGNAHASEDLPHALPLEQNTPFRAPYGLYAEQVNDTPFTVERAHNRRTWLYRVRPSAQHGGFTPRPSPLLAGDFSGLPSEPNLCGFRPQTIAAEPHDFVSGLRTLGGAGSALDRRGHALHLYTANRSMEDSAFYDADGELLLLPQRGRLTLLTEHGVLALAPGQLAIIPRGVVFAVLLEDEGARGFVAEVFGRSFRLPERGPLGANGTTDARHFQAPSAWHEDRLALGFRLVCKRGGRLYEARLDHSPFDVVAWHGNSVPLVYDLRRFSPVYNARFDHGDPSIHSVLSCPLDEPGANLLDLVIFTERWDATQHTFRPPFPHRNAAMEWNGIIEGSAEGPFAAGSYFFTPAMAPHAVTRDGMERFWEQTPAAASQPRLLAQDSLWFQFESVLPFCFTPWAAAAEDRIEDWLGVWGAPLSHFDPTRR